MTPAIVNRTAYVTGGGSGIGLAIARALVARGWAVTLCGRDEERLGRAVEDLVRGAQGDASRVHAVSADVAEEGQVRRWVGEAFARFGPPELLVNSAGIGMFRDITSLSVDEWDRVMAVNLKGAFLCVREVLPLMRARGGGYIVNIASLLGKQGMGGAAAYSASKFGMIGFTQSLQAEEKGHHIRATAICPGYVATPLVSGASVPTSEMIQPEDIAATVLYLLDLSPKVIIREIVVERIGV